ncbi:hypothetical protein GY45DRAFT_1328127 [Cubamyces sp. BRFM 1775]|nr:hypothetical protein GY45DRAFT_1328127 [Cubamyces sp. BRFM 1775]
MLSASGSSLPLSSPPAVSSLAPTYGAVLIGMLLSLALYGVTLHQGYRYSRLYRTDSSLLQLYAFIVMYAQ